MAQVWKRILKGWYGDNTWEGQLGCWKATADCRNLFRTAMKDRKVWFWEVNVGIGAMDALEMPDDQGFRASVYKAVVEIDGVMLQESLDIAAESFWA